MSTATIDLKLETAKKQSEVLYKYQPTWQEKVDNLLDRMNELNGHLNKIQSLLIGINFELERDFSGFKESEKAPKIILEITTIVSKILRVVRKSDLYPGVKTTFALLRDENRYLKELLEDSKISHELENDSEMHSIMDEFLKVSS
jgi:hypothetical protein